MSDFPLFDGLTFDTDRDGSRLARQLTAVRLAMESGDWHTLAELAAVVGAPEASVSARLRDLRKPKFGGFTIEREYVERGLFRYRMLVAVG